MSTERAERYHAAVRPSSTRSGRPCSGASRRSSSRRARGPKPSGAARRVGSARSGRVAARRRAHAEAAELRWVLCIQREAIGLYDHRWVDAVYPPLRAAHGGDRSPVGVPARTPTDGGGAPAASARSRQVARPVSRPHRPCSRLDPVVGGAHPAPADDGDRRVTERPAYPSGRSLPLSNNGHDAGHASAGHIGETPCCTRTAQPLLRRPVAMAFSVELDAALDQLVALAGAVARAAARPASRAAGRGTDSGCGCCGRASGCRRAGPPSR